jgi:hypothetical protein
MAHSLNLLPDVADLITQLKRLLVLCYGPGQVAGHCEHEASMVVGFRQPTQVMVILGPFSENLQPSHRLFWFAAVPSVKARHVVVGGPQLLGVRQTL